MQLEAYRSRLREVKAKQVTTAMLTFSSQVGIHKDVEEDCHRTRKGLGQVDAIVALHGVPQRIELIYAHHIRSPLEMWKEADHLPCDEDA